MIPCGGLCLYTYVWVCFGEGGVGHMPVAALYLIINVLMCCDDPMLGVYASYTLA